MLELATREHLRLRMLISGITGAGKTATGLMFMSALARHLGKQFAVIDTENGRSFAYVKTRFAPESFFPIPLKSYSVDAYRQAIKQAEADPRVCGIFIDSLSHAWAGEGGLMEDADKGGDSMLKWGPINKAQNKLISAITGSRCHIIATVRSKTEYLFDKGADGKTAVSVVGTSPIQRKEMPYEFGIFLNMDRAHRLTVLKTDCSIIDRLEVVEPTEEFMTPIIEWLETGEAVTELQDVVKKASQLEADEYIDIQSKLYSLKPKAVIAGFLAKYGCTPLESTSDFLQEKIEEAKEAWERKQRVAPRRTGLQTVTTPPASPEAKDEKDTKVETKAV